MGVADCFIKLLVWNCFLLPHCQFFLGCGLQLVFCYHFRHFVEDDSTILLCAQ
jgi:hypothetical protein